MKYELIKEPHNTLAKVSQSKTDFSLTLKSHRQAMDARGLWATIRWGLAGFLLINFRLETQHFILLLP